MRTSCLIVRCEKQNQNPIEILYILQSDAMLLRGGNCLQYSDIFRPQFFAFLCNALQLVGASCYNDKTGTLQTTTAA